MCSFICATLKFAYKRQQIWPKTFKNSFLLICLNKTLQFFVVCFFLIFFFVDAAGPPSQSVAVGCSQLTHTQHNSARWRQRQRGGVPLLSIHLSPWRRSVQAPQKQQQQQQPQQKMQRTTHSKNKCTKKTKKRAQFNPSPFAKKINPNNNDKLNSIRKRWHLQCFTAITMRQSAVMGRLVGHKTAEIRQMPLLYFFAKSFGIDSADICELR